MTKKIKIGLTLTSLLIIIVSIYAFVAENDTSTVSPAESGVTAEAQAGASASEADKVAPPDADSASGSKADTALTSETGTAPASRADTAPTSRADAAPTEPSAPTATEAPPIKPAAPNTPDPGTDSVSMEQQVVALVNKEREAIGLAALKVNGSLAGVAETKAEDLRDQNYFAHESPTYGSPFDMMEQFSIHFSTAGENLAKGQRTPAEVMDDWMRSPGHKANILNSDYTEIGVGYVKSSNGTTYWVQQFIRP